jgi:hypothetical protein
MLTKLMATILTIGLAFLVTPVFAAAPEDQSTTNSSISATSAFDAIFVPEVSGSPAELLLLSPLDYPYWGFCSQTCQHCEAYGGGIPGNNCPPDPETGWWQACTRTRSC